MVEAHMYFAIGFILAALGILIVAPLVHGRAVRLTRQRLESMIPTSAAEIMAGKDLLRAEFAMSTRQLEIALSELKAKSANERAELGRKTDAVDRLKNELTALRAQLNAPEEQLAVRDADQAATPGADAAMLALASAQAEELAALRMQVESLTKWLNDAGVEIRAMRAEQEELEAGAANAGRRAVEVPEFPSPRGRACAATHQSGGKRQRWDGWQPRNGRTTRASSGLNERRCLVEKPAI